MTFMKCEFQLCNKIAKLPPKSIGCVNMGDWQAINKGWIWIPDSYCDISYLCPQHAQELLDLMESASLYLKEGAFNATIQRLLKERNESTTRNS